MDAVSTGNRTTITRISNPTTLLTARIVIAVLGFLSVVVYIAGNIALANSLLNLTPDVQAGLNQLGLSATFYAALSVGLSIVFGLISIGVGAFIFLRRSDDRVGLMMAVFLMAFGAAFVAINSNPSTWSVHPVIYLGWLIVGLVAWGLIDIVFLLFPDGKIPFRWLYIPMIVQFAISGLWNFAPYDSPFSPLNWPPLLLALAIVFEVVSAGYTIRWKYKHSLTPTQRQQSKWPAIGGILAVTIYATTFFVPVIFPQVNSDAAAKLLYNLYNSLAGFTLILLPLTLTFAILRYRLWDIDLLFNRSLVYSVVTILILVLFFVVTLAVQSVMGSQQFMIALLISALVAVLAFNPVRRTVQRLVDRRLYGLRFDLNELNAAQKLPEVKTAGALSGRKLGEYDVLDVIGKGGMGEVYKGQTNGKTVAIKILPDDLAQESEFRQRFEREAQTLTALNHINIVQMVGSGSSDGIAYLAMEYIEGEELGRKLRTDSPLSLEDTRAIFKGLADALDYAHEQGFVHRDIKPSNVMLRKSSPTTGKPAVEAVLMDFGVAKIREARTGLTNTGVIGTIEYMAPEQIMAATAVDRRADIYALGVMAYEMLTGERPFKGNAAQVMFAHLQQPAPDPRDTNDSLPSPAAKAVMQAMSKKPDERFATASAFAAAL